MSGDLTLAWRLARRELRSGLTGFRVFLACLALGVAAVAGVGALSESIVAGIRADARVLLGGDVDLRMTHRPIAAEHRRWLAENAAQVSEIVEMRAMARQTDGNARQLVELKAVDDAFPLYGGFRLAEHAPLAPALAQRNGVWGAVVEPRLLTRLNVEIGDRIQVGDAVFEIRALIHEEADRGTRAFDLGPRLMVPLPAIAETGLVQPGSMIRYHYRLALPPGTDPAAWIAGLNDRFPDAGWLARSTENAAPNIQRFVDRVRLFLTLVGFTAMLIGGVGIGNAVRGYLDSRRTTIATLKCIGGTGPLVFRTYLLQILALAALGIGIGVVIGGLVPLALAPFLAGQLPVALQPDLYAGPLLLAVAFGVLTTLAFSLWPLGQAREVSPGGLFRALVAPPGGRPRAVYIAGMAVATALLAGLAVATAYMPHIALWFVIGAAATFAVFRLIAGGVAALLRAAPRPRRVTLRLALANIHRPGAPTASVVLSLGLGITVLVAIALIEGNLTRQVSETLPEEAPGFYFIDIQPDQIAAFEELVRGFPGVQRTESVPMLRGRIAALNGTPVEQITPPPEFAWILRGDRGLTWSREPPRHGSRIAAGDWWPPDYAGPPLVSMDRRAAEAFGLRIGDTITINLLGRNVTAEIANLRDIEWTTLAINFVLIFSPGVLEAAPQTHIATAKVDAAAEAALEEAVTDRFRNVSAVRVKEVLESVDAIMQRLAGAVRAIAAIAVFAGALVLAGAVAATHRRRVREAVVLKVLGATRRSLLGTYIVEFGLLGLVTGAVAAVLGSIVGWAVVEHVMRAEWSFIPLTVAATTAISVAITISLGLLGTWRALGHKAAPVLRNE